MRGSWLEDRTLSLRDDLPLPRPPAGEALVRVLLSGICNTDLELVRGYYPYRGIIGHEFVGVVEAGPGEIRGRRVVGEINAWCDHCATCRAGRRTHCENRTVLGIVGRDGSHADYLALPARNLHVVPDGITNETAVFTEPLAAALEIRQQICVSEQDRVLVVGDGKLGLLIAQTLSLTGCHLLVLGRHEKKLAILRAKQIATSGDADTVEPRSYDIAVECTGNPDGFDIARRSLRPRGTLVMKSTYAAEITLDAAALVVDEITVVGSRCGPFEPALALLGDGKIDVGAMIEARYPRAEALAAFDHAARRGSLKVLIGE